MDEMLDAGYGWTDQLITQWDDQAVFVTRNIDGPELQVEYMRVVFPDGSCLYLGCDGTAPIDAGRVINMVPAGSDAEAQDCDAMKVFGAWVKALYERASASEIDTDI